MIFSKEKQKLIETFGRKIEESIEDIGIIVQYPDSLINVEYDDSLTGEKLRGVPVRKFLLMISYTDDGKISAAKKERLADYKRQLQEEMERIGGQLDGMV